MKPDYQHQPKDNTIPYAIPRSPIAATSQAFAVKKTLNSTTALHPAVFPHWNGLIGSTQTLRLLPDAANHDAPVVEKRVVKMPFDAGILGGSDEPHVVTFVSPETYGLLCPTTEGIRHWWRQGDEMKELARRYHRIPSFFMSCLVVGTTIVETDPPTNPVRLASFSKPLYENSVKPAFMDPDFDYSPVDPVEGRDFHVRKSQNGAWPSYASSAFAYKPRPLTDAELATIEKNGLWDIGAAILSEAPTPDLIAQMEQMFQDSVDNQPFDPARYPSFRAFPIAGPRGAGNGAMATAPAPIQRNGNGAAAAPDRSARLSKLRANIAHGATPNLYAEETAAVMTELRAKNTTTVARRDDHLDHDDND